MLDVITIGSATKDVFVKSAALEIQESDTPPFALEACFPLGAKVNIDELTFQTGGGATNAAATFAQLGFKTATVSSIGEDPNGREICTEYKSYGISEKFLQKNTEDQTAYSIIIVAGSGERTILVYRGASREIDPERIPWNKLKAKWFYLTSLGGDIELVGRILEHAKNAGIKVAWNPGNGELKRGIDELEPLIRKVDIFNLNREEASALTGIGTGDLNAIIARLKGLPKRVLLITDGMGGTYSAEGEEVLHSDIIEVPRVNTTGAGDAFGSGFVAGILRRDDVRHALAVGTWNATGLVQEMGAKRGLLIAFPSDENINKVTIEPWK
ncbi:MAG: carbohydrate kinase family protein [Patescibacteria group bacterium]|nr:carbohydrate kinase family protein [Patescibacteria group bacterium]